TAMAGSVADTTDTTGHLDRDSSIGLPAAMATPAVDITTVSHTRQFTGRQTAMTGPVVDTMLLSDMGMLPGRRTAMTGPVVDTMLLSDMGMFPGHRTAIRDTVQRKTPAVV